MVENSARTIYNVKLNNAFLAGYHYEVLPNTTLNEKFDILPEDKTPYGEYPKLRYFVIGTGGDNFINENGCYKFCMHEAIDAALFNHIPFVIRELGNDLTYNERKEYRLRTQIVVDNITYIAYYAKVTDNVDYRPYIKKITKRGKESVISKFDTDSDRFLNPKPKIRPKSIEEGMETSCVLDSFKVSFIMSPSDQKELRNVFKILGLPVTAKITELGLCHAYEIPFNGSKEIIDTQISFHIPVDLEMQREFDSREPFRRDIVLGGSDPMFISDKK